MSRAAQPLLLLACALPWVQAHAEPAAQDAPAALMVAPVVVTGSRREVAADASPVPVTVVDRDAVEASGARDAAELLEGHPGLAIVRSFRGAGLEVEGLDPRHVLVLVDGERVAGRTGEQTDLSRLPIEAIERVEVVKGATSALYGADALGGVVNIITRSARAPAELEGTLESGTLGRLGVSTRGGAARDTWDAHVAAGLHRAGAFHLDDSPATSGSARDDASATVSARLRPSDALTLAARVQYLFREQRATDALALPRGLDDAPRWKVTDRDQTGHTLAALLSATHRAASGGQLEVRASTSVFDDTLAYDQRGSDREDREEHTRELVGGLALSYQRLVAGAHHLVVGLEGHVEALESQRVEGGEASRQRLALHLQDEWTVLDGAQGLDDGDAVDDLAPAAGPVLVLVAGVRLDVDSQFGPALAPRVAARFDPTPELALHASFGLGFRAPGFRELYLFFENPGVGYAVVGSPELDPERSRSLRLGAAWTPTDAVRVEVALFRHDLADLILTTPLTPVEGAGASLYTYRNVDAATSQGGELSVSLRAARALRLDLSYTLTDARDDATDLVLPGRATHRGHIALTGRLAATATALTARAELVGPRALEDPADPNRRLDADAYAHVDLRLTQDLGDHLTLFGGVDNLLDAGDPTTLPLRPRSLYLGLTGRL